MIKVVDLVDSSVHPFFFCRLRDNLFKTDRVRWLKRLLGNTLLITSASLDLKQVFALVADWIVGVWYLAALQTFVSISAINLFLRIASCQE